MDVGPNDAGEHYVPAAVTQEELDRLTVPEGLPDAERARRCVCGDPVQQYFLVRNLPGLVSSAGAEGFAAVASQLETLAAKSSEWAVDEEDGQIELAGALTTVLHSRRLPSTLVSDVIMPIVLPRATGISCSSSGGGKSNGGRSSSSSLVVQEAWLACFKELAAAVDTQTLHSTLLPAALRAGRDGEAQVAARCACCRLLGAIAPAMLPEAVDMLLLPTIVAMCQDSDFEVRRTMCGLLPAVAQAVAASEQSSSKITRQLVAEALQLLEDEEVHVRAAAWHAMAELLQLKQQVQGTGSGSGATSGGGEVVEAPARRAVLVQLLQQCRTPDFRVEQHRSLTSVFGVLMGRLVADMNGETDVGACLSGFRSLAWRHDVPTRRNCAAAFLPVLRAVTARRYASHLHDTLVRLAGDSEAEVRREMALALPDVAVLLGAERCMQYLRPIVVDLLGDESQEVRTVLVPRLVQLMEQFRVYSGELTRKVYAELTEPLLALEAGSGHDWRLQLEWLRTVAELPRFYDGDLLYDKFLPPVLRLLEDGAASITAAAADAVAAIWRARCSRPQPRTTLYGRLVGDLAMGTSWRRRMAFIEICSAAACRFSGKWLKAYLMDACSLLAFDHVPNVQLRLCPLMPVLKKAISLPEDVAQLSRLNAAMSHLLAASDPDVASAARMANQEFRQQVVRLPGGVEDMAGSSSGMAGDDSAVQAALAQAAAAAYDAQDSARQLWERDQLAFEPEQLTRIRSELEAHDKARRPALPPPAASSPRLPMPLSRTETSLPSSRQSSARSGTGSSREGAACVQAAATARAGKLPGTGAAAVCAVHRRATSDIDSTARAQPPARLQGRQLQQQRAGRRVNQSTSDSVSIRGGSKAQQPASAAGRATGDEGLAATDVPTTSKVKHAATHKLLPSTPAPRAVSRLASMTTQPRRATSTGYTVGGREPEDRESHTAAAAAGVSSPAPHPQRRATSTGVPSDRRGGSASDAGSGGAAASSAIAAMQSSIKPLPSTSPRYHSGAKPALLRQPSRRTNACGSEARSKWQQPAGSSGSSSSDRAGAAAGEHMEGVCARNNGASEEVDYSSPAAAGAASAAAPKNKSGPHLAAVDAAEKESGSSLGKERSKAARAAASSRVADGLIAVLHRRTMG